MEKKLNILNIPPNTVIVEYKGGLGNQMFQYAFQSMKERQGCDCYSDLLWYESNENVKFKLIEAFPNIYLKENIYFGENDIQKYYMINLPQRAIHKITKGIVTLPFWWHKFIYDEENEFEANLKAMNHCQGYYRGYWQALGYFDDYREELIEKFEFNTSIISNNDRLKSLINDIEASNSVAIHVRGGDYLSDINSNIYGGLCTQVYYEKAMQHMKNSLFNPKFFVFTNDSTWCKKNISKNDMTYVSDILNPDREDWVDMMLMSKCKHHIIANSTFSWWGAWLSQYDGINIAPKGWIRGNDAIELIPKGWVRI